MKMTYKNCEVTIGEGNIVITSKKYNIHKTYSTTKRDEIELMKMATEIVDRMIKEYENNK